MFFKRRRRDLNPRAAINDLHPFQGCPFSLLGTSPRLNFNSYLINNIHYCNGEGGIRTHAPLRTNGFQDRLVMTTSIPLHICFYRTHLSSTKQILSNIFLSVNTFFYFFQNMAFILIIPVFFMAVSLQKPLQFSYLPVLLS